MALNYSHRSLFSAHTVNGYLCEGPPYAECFWRPLQSEMEEWRYLKDKVEAESKGSDIVDLLPSDPFGMDIKSTFTEMDIKSTFTAITGWLENLNVDVWSNNPDEYDLFPGFNPKWNNVFKSQPFSSTSSVHSDDLLNSSVASSFSSSLQLFDDDESDQTLDAINDELIEALAQYDIEFQPAMGISNESTSCIHELLIREEDVGFSNESTSCIHELLSREEVGFSNESTSCSHELLIRGEEVEGAAKSEDAPHDAFKFCLMYLGVKDLFSVERVCRSLLSEVRGEPLLWRSIHIDRPLSEKITDDLLFKLALRADGTLSCLSLANCPKITNDGIKRVLETNPRVTKLSLPGCTGLSIKGILDNIVAHNSNKDVPGIKYLRITGICGMTYDYYEEFRALLGVDDSCHRPHFYHQGNLYLPSDDDQAIDIEMCPRCEEIRLVYDCPSEECQVKDHASPVCRACILCIARCAQCGRCINDNQYYETFCLDLLCSDCFMQQRMYQDNLDMNVDPCTST